MRLLNNDKIVIGYDLCNSYSQISYAYVDSDKVETVSSVAGAEIFSIPTVLCKKEGSNQWLYGKEAVRYAEENPGILVENLLQLAIDGEPVLIEGVTFQPVALLTLFVKRSMGLLSAIASPDKIVAMVITCEKPDARILEVLGQVFAGLQLKTDRIYFQSHVESFYYYMLHQQEELWSYQTLLCEYRDNYIQVYRMECNRRTKPVVVHIDEARYPFISYEPMPEGDSLRRDKMERMDEELLQLMEGICEDKIISSVYLIGENFTEEWLKGTLRYLCRGRRVFQGNNLYSKGACFGMLERLGESEAGRSHVFLGSDKLKFNIGMRIKRRGQDSYYALLDAGANWYEVEETTEFYLHEGNTVELMLTSIIGGKNKLAEIELEGLPEGVSRLRLHLYLQDERHLVAEITDLGFGEFREATHRVWEEILELGDK